METIANHLHKYLHTTVPNRRPVVPIGSLSRERTHLPRDGPELRLTGTRLGPACSRLPLRRTCLWSDSPVAGPTGLGSGLPGPLFGRSGLLSGSEDRSPARWHSSRRVRPDLGPGRTDLGSERTDLTPRRTDLRPGRTDLGSERPDLQPVELLSGSVGLLSGPVGLLPGPAGLVSGR